MYGSNSHLRARRWVEAKDLKMEEGMVAGIINILRKEDREKMRYNSMFIDYFLCVLS